MRYLTGAAAVATIVAIASAVSLAARAQTADQPATSPAATETPPQTPPSSPVIVAPASPSVPASPVAPATPVVPTAPAATTVAPPPNGTPATVMDLGEVDGVLGKNVRSTAGDDMGRIVDVMVGGNGQVHAAIIDFGGFLGVGSRKVAVDWRALQFASDGKVGRITTGLSRNQIRLAPEYKNGEAVVVLNAPAAATAPAAPPAAAPVATAPPTPVAPMATPMPGAATSGAAIPGAAIPPADDTSAQRPKPAP